MQRHTPIQSCRKRLRTGSLCFRSRRIGGYLGLTLAALFSTAFFPVLLSLFKSHRVDSEPHPFHKQGDLGIVDGLSWTKEATPPHMSRIVLSGEDMEALDLKKKLWKRPPNRGFEPCVVPRKSYNGLKISRGYLLVHANGGLNQMRAGICDMVAVARIINATLVIPELDKRSFWQDSSNFSDVFDEEYFIKALEKDVSVVKKLPRELSSTPRARKQFRSWSGLKYYQEEITQLWKDYKVIRAAKSDSRLANNNLPLDIQKLRCRVHYDALRFAPPIEALGKKLVERMRSSGPYIALHLRYEKDILAFSGCSYGLSDSETEELTVIRESTPYWRVKNINSSQQRLEGLCPLTPTEVGIFLQALGYPSSTRVYIAAGAIYGGNSSMAGLQAHFPNLMRKEMIATSEELGPFDHHASQMAALDYIVSVESDVFVPSYSGNMARAVEGHRRYLGHRKTIIPDRRQLVALFDQLDQGLLKEGFDFSVILTEIHNKRQGAPRKRRGPLPGSKGRERFRTEEAFYNNPLPDCLCQKHSLSLHAGKSSIQKASGETSGHPRSGSQRENTQSLGTLARAIEKR